MLQQDVTRVIANGVTQTVLGISNNLDLTVFTALGYNTQYVMVTTDISCHIILAHETGGPLASTNTLLLVREHPLILDITGIRYLRHIQSSEGAANINITPLFMDHKNSYGSALRPVKVGLTVPTTLVPAELDLNTDFSLGRYPEYIYVSTLTQAHVRLTTNGATLPASINSLMVTREKPLIIHSANVQFLSYVREGGVNGVLNVVPLESIVRRNPPALRVVDEGIFLVAISALSLSQDLSAVGDPEYVRIQTFEPLHIRLGGVGAGFDATTNSYLVVRDGPVILHTAGITSIRYRSGTGGNVNFQLQGLRSLHPNDI